MNDLSLATLYLAAINLVAFAAFGIDKRRARIGAWRIPEKTLLLLAVLGGSVGAWLGMTTFHHKTRKPLFSVGVPVILLLQIAAVLVMRRMAG
ncbi:MAG: DUF1294 domain-containing protein [Mogibacterium sp.]|nr:DUF1294 domain-containing protein [Lentisphaeria bacterium]MBR0374160.1 DUF1294 domain-containing protein [Mogibacterium sp.]